MKRVRYAIWAMAGLVVILMTAGCALKQASMSGDEAKVLEAAGIEGEDGNLVVGPYLVEVSTATGAPVPVLRREQIRASGFPTIPFGLDLVLPVERRAA